MIDLDAPEPLFRQIAADLERRIGAGEIGRRLPGVRTIAETYGVAHATAARAVRELVERGVATSVPGRGTFVVQRPTNSGHDKRPDDH